MPREPIRQCEAACVELDGRRLLSFAGCNYLGLAHDGRVLLAAREAAGRVGVSTSASRETSGNSPEHSGLEHEVAAFVTRDDPDRGGLLLPDGYTANLAAAQGLAERCRYAVIDDRAHASLRDAARLAGLEVRLFRHLDAEDAASEVAGLDAPAVVMTDGVFTADGAVAPLSGLRLALRDGDALLVDDCHGFCVLGDGGRGTCDELGLDDPRLVITTTLAKGLGCGGGVVIAGHGFIERLTGVSTAYICTTPVSPIVAAAARAALDIVRDEPGRVARLRENAGTLRDVLAAEGFVMDAVTGGGIASPIRAFQAPDHLTGTELSRALLEQGVYVPLMSYPGGPAREYFRASVTAEHTTEQIARLGAALRATVGVNQPTCHP